MDDRTISVVESFPWNALAEAAENLARACRRAAKASSIGLAESPGSEQQSHSMQVATPACQDRPLLTQQQLADRLGCNVRTLRRWAHEGLVPSPIKIGRALRWDPDVVDEFVRKGVGSRRAGSSAHASGSRRNTRRDSQGGRK